MLKAAKATADGVWREVVQWNSFARDVVGGQLGEKLQFLYYARGSLFETKYWLNRALERNLMPIVLVQEYASQLTDVARQLNSFAATCKSQRGGTRAQSKAAREPSAEYLVDSPNDISLPLLTDKELAWLSTVPNT